MVFAKTCIDEIATVQDNGTIVTDYITTRSKVRESKVTIHPKDNPSQIVQSRDIQSNDSNSESGPASGSQSTGACSDAKLSSDCSNSSDASSVAHKRRRTMRDTNRIALGNKHSLQFRRMSVLFFNERRSKRCKILQIDNTILKLVNTFPNIYVIDDFLTDVDLEYLHKRIQIGRFQRSYVDKVCSSGNDNTTRKYVSQHNDSDSFNSADTTSPHQKSLYDDDHRTSTFLSFTKQQDARVSAIETKAAALLGDFSTAAVEPLQLVRYLPGQFFGPHHDLGDLEPDGSVVLPRKSCIVKRRIVTIFCYLNDIKDGGATIFPNTIGKAVRIQPQRGRAVLFSNVLSTGLPDSRTVHEGETVDDEVKYGLNIWICEK